MSISRFVLGKVVACVVLMAFSACAKQEKGDQAKERLSASAEDGVEARAAGEGEECLNHEPPESLGVCRRAQEGPLWCWAATAEMMLEYLKQPSGEFHQYEMMARVPEQSGCQPDPCDQDPEGFYETCNAKGWPFANNTIEAKFNAKHSGGPLRWEDLWKEMEAERPVAYGWCSTPQGGGCTKKSDGHMVVIAGAFVEDGVKNLLIVDPKPCCGRDSSASDRIPYATYAAYFGKFSRSHWASYYCLTDTSAESQPQCEDYATASQDELSRDDLLPYAGASPRAAAERVLNEVVPDIRSLLSAQLSSASLLKEQLGRDVEEGEKLRLGQGLRLFELNREALKGGLVYKDNAWRYLEETGVVGFLLELDETAVARVDVRSVVVEAGDDRQELWRLERLGWANRSQLLFDARREYEMDWEGALPELIEVSVPALNISFVAPRYWSWRSVSKVVGECRPGEGEEALFHGLGAKAGSRSGEQLLRELRRRVKSLTGAGVS